MREVAYFMFFKQKSPQNIVWILLKMQTKSRKKTAETFCELLQFCFLCKPQTFQSPFLLATQT